MTAFKQQRQWVAKGRAIGERDLGIWGLRKTINL